MNITGFIVSYIDTIIIIVLGLLSFWKSYYDFKKEYLQLPPNVKFKGFTRQGLLLVTYILIVSFLTILKDYRGNKAQEMFEKKIDSLNLLNREIKIQNITFLDTLSKFGFMLNKVDNSLIRLDSTKKNNNTTVLLEKGRPLISLANVPGAVTVKNSNGDDYTLSFLLTNVGKLPAMKMNVDAFILDNKGNNVISILKTKTSAVAQDDIFYPDDKGYYKQVNYGFYLKEISKKDTSYIYIRITYSDQNNKYFLYQTIYYWIPEKGFMAEKATQYEYDQAKTYLIKNQIW